MNDVIRITTEIEVSKERISDLLCTAFEGGSNYWIGAMAFDLPNNPSFYPTYDGKAYPKYLWVPLNPDGAIRIRPDGDPDWYHLGPLQLAAGLRLLAAQYPEHFQKFMTENEDAGTGDTYLQLCIFGEVKYS